MPEKTVAQKMLIKPGYQVLVVNPLPAYRDLLGPLPEGAVLLEETAGKADAILLFAPLRAGLEAHLPALNARLASKAMLWVLYYKGTSRVETDVNRDIIAAYAQTVGYQAVAIVSVNSELSALRLKPV
jgi:hypothetical protein